ncbi:Dethiobiotin synthetase [hydrothermal vent metagenome]|uniref:Dethiobiotin synthetase n=1 Tax=hydrothermal vent metagenome TaxID=652676 RepID=A0A3B0SAM8_9ZZZZ
MKQKMRLIITGTDTDIGKTVFSAALADAMNAAYWKPVQAGLEDGGDSQRIATLSSLPPDRILPEAYRLTTPCSPDLAAQIDGISIDPGRLNPPETDGPLVIEGAGGALVPLSGNTVYADLFAKWDLPVIVVAGTALGTINHSLLTIEALRVRNVTICGIAFVGDAAPHSEETICRIGHVRHLGRLPHLPSLDRDSLRKAFIENFNIEDFISRKDHG